ncbi:DUF2989 domain-containing protein [Alteromonas sp. H39]|uniref:DUF2989 domain-containing protein n=1 Tax=Alteromonas sp. H39 TaxID=3389876 RepID=UPI0039DFE9E9
MKIFKKAKGSGNFGGLFSNFSTISASVILLLCVTGLSACSDMFEPTISEICQEQGAFCTDLNQDHQCRYEKAEIIRDRYYHQNEATDGHKYNLLLKFEDYLSCIEKAAHIEHKKFRDKEATRLKGVLTARKEIDRLSRETRQSSDPYLSYYQWSRYGHEDALQRFMHYSRTGQVTDPELLINLASIQVKDDLDATVNTLYKALSLYQNSEDVDEEIYATLVTIGMEKENYRMAYVWSGVLANYNDNVNTSQQQAIAQQFELPVKVLNEVTDDITSALDSGEFDAQSLGLYRL